MASLLDIESSLGFGSPTELYLFEHGEDFYAYNSGSKKVLHTDGILYSPLSLSREKLQRSSDDVKNTIKIEMPGDSPVPLLFRNKRPAKKVTLKIFRFHRYTKESWLFFNKEAEVPGEFRCIFSGEVIQSTWNDISATLDCAPTSALQRRQCLRFGYQSQCNYHVFDELCGLKIQDWQYEITVTEITGSGYTLKVTGLSEDEEFYKGSLVSVDEDDFRDVLSASGNQITILTPFDGLKVGQKLQITKGCDRSAKACKSFNNFDNFFGFLTIPTENPFV